MEYIQTDAAVERVGAALQREPLFAADTEAAGYHRYHDRICLLQISTRTETFLIDTLAVKRLDAMEAPFAAPDREVVLHDADYDLRLLARDFSIHVRGLFDTKLAAQLIGEAAFGLGALVEKYIGARLDKKHQRADWAQRPLPAEMLEYATEDTRHLPALRDVLKAELERLGRWSWAQEEFELRESARWAAEPNDDAYLKLKNTRDLSPRQMAILRELHGWREGVASRRDVAAFRVVGNDMLVAVARAQAADMRTLSHLEGVPSSIVDRYGHELIAAVQRGLTISEHELPQRPRAVRRPPPDADFDDQVEKLKRARDAAAESLGLERGFLMPRQQLEAIARMRPRNKDELMQVEDMRRWQVEALGDRLLRTVRGK